MTSDNANVYSSNITLTNLKTVSDPSLLPLNEAVNGKASSLRSSKAAQKCLQNLFMRPRDIQLKLSGLDLDKLKKLLLSYNEYPDKYRVFIWQYLLQLPNNYEAFLDLSKKGIFSTYVNLQEKYPIKSLKLFCRFQRLVSNLAHWTPIFGEGHYLLLFVFPFVKFLQTNNMICFEIIATVLSNWCKDWFENFPHPPHKILAAVESILSRSDPNLAEHYMRHDITSEVYAWPLLSTSFSEVLEQKDWLILWDHIISNVPSFILTVVVAFNSVNRSAIFRCSSKEDFHQFFHHRNSWNIKQIIKKANHLQTILPNNGHPDNCIKPFIPDPCGQYTVFNQNPLCIEASKRSQDDIPYEAIQNCFVSSKNIKQIDSYTEIKPYRDEESLIILEENISKLMNKQTTLHTLMQDIRLAELDLVKNCNQIKHSNSERLLSHLKEQIHLKSILFNHVFEETFLKSKETNRELQIFKQQLQRHMVDPLRISDQFDKQDISIHDSQKHQYEHKFLQVACLNSQSIILLQEIRSQLQQMDEQKIEFHRRKIDLAYNKNFDVSKSSPAKKSLQILESMLDDPMKCLPSAFLTDVRDLRRKILNEVLNDCRSSRLQSISSNSSQSYTVLNSQKL